MPPAAAPALERCVADTERFLADHWGRRPLHARGVDPGGFADLLSLDAADQIVTSTALRAPAFRLVKGGTTLPLSAYVRDARVGSRPIADLIDVGRVARLFAEGATVVLQGLHRSWPPLAAFCRDLELALSHPVQANAYLTPPTSAGLRVHSDTHDVFALHTHGRKQWVLYAGEGDEPSLETHLEPGDALYLPSGTRHAARTVDEPSLHVTIGVRTTTWADVLRRAVDVALDDEAFRERLPAGYPGEPEVFAGAVAARLRDLAARLDKLDAADVAARARRRFVSARPPLLRGALHDLLSLERVGDTTVVRRRAGTVCDLAVSGPEAVLTLGDRTLRMPALAAPALRQVVAVPAGGTVRAADLADHLDADGRVVLVRRLVLEGLLTLAGAV